ncbi:MAG: glycosyltransferase family 2 protein [Planctomycetes bacterium]|nr:glycosyltransferase family 2 protein [Planctomycetota bacterium]
MAHQHRECSPETTDPQGSRCPFDPEQWSQRTAADEDGTSYECDASIGLLCYRDRQFIDDLLASIEQSGNRYRYEWLLSDNGSTDGTREMVREKYPYVTILENGRNLGVAGGRNRLFWNSRAKYTMILDSDTLVQPGAIDTLIDTAEANPKAAMVAPRLEYRDGSLQLSCRPFPRFHHILIEGTKYRKYFEWTGIPARVDMRHIDHDRMMPIDCVYGAAMLVRNRITREVGGFDEGYFYQYEDYDLCFRFKQAGYENWYQPSAAVTHFYEREERGVFHARLQTHLKSILRFQTRNMWGISDAPVLHRRDLDHEKVPPVGCEPAA